LTEFLPVSSSGHLVLAEHLLGVQSTGDVTFEVFVHFGTFLSVVVVFWSDLVRIFSSIGHAIVHAKFTKAYYLENEPFRWRLYVVGSIPAGIIGILYEDSIALAFDDPKLVATMLVVTGLILFSPVWPGRARQTGVAADDDGDRLRAGHRHSSGSRDRGRRSAPGCSAGLRQPTRQILLHARPAVIFGATLLKTKDLLLGHTGGIGTAELVVATAVAFLSGIAAIKILMRVIERGKFGWFAVYCFIVGILGIIFI